MIDVSIDWNDRIEDVNLSVSVDVDVFLPLWRNEIFRFDQFGLHPRKSMSLLNVLLWQYSVVCQILIFCSSTLSGAFFDTSVIGW